MKHKLMPLEPTEAMLQAACLHQSNVKYANYNAWWNDHSTGISERIRNLIIEDYKVMVAAYMQEKKCYN